MRAASLAGAAALICLIVVGIGGCSKTPLHVETLTHGRFRNVHIYAPKGEVRHFVLFLSGDGGWGAALGSIAESLATTEGTLVAGIDTADLFVNLEKDGGDCVFPVGDLENLSHFVQAYYKVPTYYTPILVGHSAGASFAYAALAQARPGTFIGALSLSFCADFDLHKPLCKAGDLAFTPRADGGGVRLVPPKELHAPWIALHGTADAVCSLKEARAFVAQTPGAAFVELPGVNHNYGGMKSWLPQFNAAFASIAAKDTLHLQAPPSSLADLPIIEVLPAGGGGGAAADASDTFAILLSGDGGWAGLDKDVASVLSARGIPVAGLDSLRYFWTARTPAGVAADIDRMLRYYAEHWGRKRALLIGYSQGADVLPFAVNRLPPQSRELVKLTALIGIGATAAFEFHVSNWIGSSNDELPTGVELARMSAADTLCLYGDGDDESVCPQVAAAHARVIKLPGGHHFGGNYDGLANLILERPVAK